MRVEFSTRRLSSNESSTAKMCLQKKKTLLVAVDEVRARTSPAEFGRDNGILPVAGLRPDTVFVLVESSDVALSLGYRLSSHPANLLLLNGCHECIAINRYLRYAYQCSY